MKYIKHILKEIGYSIDDFLRRMCGSLSEDARIIIILVMLLLFSIGSIYITVSSIYNMGRERERKETYEIQHIKGLDITGKPKVQNDTIHIEEYYESEKESE